ncbi:hypothetical protein IJ674_06285 [bacterium]|nr:hypothetical protein [bacterium]
MNNIKICLKELKEKYGLVALRADMASEVTTVAQLREFKQLSFGIGLNFTVKVGGCDALTDIHIAKEIGATSIIAPMIESEYSLQKFVDVSKSVYGKNLRDVNLYINIETITAYNNLENILSSPCMDFIKGVVLGRDDMAKSFGISLNNINSESMLNIVKIVSQKVEGYKKDFVVGGGIRPQAAAFLKSVKEEYLSNYETRRIVFDSDAILSTNSEEGLQRAVEFEIMWLKYCQKSNYIDDFYAKKRIEELSVYTI